MGFDPCGENSYYYKMLAGAATVAIGVDGVLPLPPIVHHAAAGVAVKYYCDGVMPGFDRETAKCAGFGVAGAMLYGAILMR